jgi:hypothetical protein
MRARTALLATALALAASGAGAGAAAATPGPTPDEGLTGACNMTNTHAAFGMFYMAVQSGPGLEGMFTAIRNTGGSCIESD